MSSAVPPCAGLRPDPGFARVEMKNNNINEAHFTANNRTSAAPTEVGTATIPSACSNPYPAPIKPS